MISFAALCALAAQVPPQSVLPHPPGPAPDHFGVALALDGPRAVVGMMYGDDAAIWSYRRDGLGWVAEAPFPDTIFRAGFEASFVDHALALSGDVAVFGDTAHELVFDGAGWVVQDVLPGVRFVDVDQANGVAIGTAGNSIVVAERGPAGWALAHTFVGFPLAAGRSMAIEGSVGVVGDAAWFQCGPLDWDGQFVIVERDAATGSWALSQVVRLTGCRETLLGAELAVRDGRIFASRELPAQVGIYTKGAGGTWALTGAIDPPGVTLALVSPQGSIDGEAGEPPAMWIGSGTAVIPYRPGNATSGPLFMGRFHETLAGTWEFAGGDLRPMTLSGPCTLPGGGASPTTPHPYSLDSGPDAAVGVLLPAQGAGCAAEVLTLDPVVGTSICTARRNSTGAPAHLDLVGSTRRDAGFTALVASDLPPGVFALPAFSTSPGFVANPGGSQGDLCLGTPITRLLGAIGAADGAGVFQVPVDLASLASGLPPGTPLRFQVWYRDTSGSGLATSNLTNGALMEVW